MSAAGAVAKAGWHPVPGVAILRPESHLFFANVDLATVPDVDLTAAKMLAETREELAGRGVRLVYARDVGQVRDVIRMEDATGDVYRSINDALAALATETRP